MSIPVNPEDRIIPIHPGEFLREDLMKPLHLSAKALATALRVPTSRVSAIVRERRGIDAEMALPLERYFHMSAHFWMNWQTQYDLTMAADRHLPRIRREVRPAPRNRKTGELKPASIA
jgi:addiction module HigA family antidote